ncbi:hypothetical protein [Microbulbifer epialgicus]|uniref:Membrane domain of glycerophosphoryl diester phosphodiesterase n=1 Tax=Microbulbifer epialgicus TaxID=393907 RepID=A0ABV4NUM0_9GAMM
MSDIYKAPESELTNREENSDFGSIEKGIAGDYSFSIGEAISEGWQLSKGKKRTVWLGMLLYMIAATAISFIIALITGYPVFDFEGTTEVSLATSTIYNVLVTFVEMPLAAGLMMIGIKIARGSETSGTEVFAHFDKIIPLIITNIIMGILILIGLFLLVIPGIYLMVAYMFAIPLIVDQNLGPWQALETSRKAITKNWFSFFGFTIATILILLAGFLALLIGAIWTLPLFFIAIGVAYRKVFGAPQGA